MHVGAPVAISQRWPIQCAVAVGVDDTSIASIAVGIDRAVDPAAIAGRRTVVVVIAISRAAEASQSKRQHHGVKAPHSPELPHARMITRKRARLGRDAACTPSGSPSKTCANAAVHRRLLWARRGGDRRSEHMHPREPAVR
jgi:hypothetical protein